MTRKQARGNATVDRVLDAALALYSAGDGGRAITIQALADASETSIGSLYHHFGGLDGVAAALYQRSMAALLDAIAAALPPRARTPRPGVVAFVTAYLGWVEANPATARFIHGSTYAPFLTAHATAIRADKAEHIAPILAWFEPFIAAGAVVKLPPAYYEMLLVGPCAEVSRRWLSGSPDLDPTTAAHVLPERIWRALEPAT